VPAPRFSLTWKVFFGTAFVVAAVLGLSLLLASRSANRTAADAIQRGLEGTREQVQSMLEVRERGMMTGARVFVQSAPFRGIVESRNTSDALDQSIEAVQQLLVDWVQITDQSGVRLAKSDEPGAPSLELARSALIGRALEGQKVAGYGASQNDDVLFQAVAVPIERPVAGTGSVVGVLMATRAVDSVFLAGVRAATGGKTDVVAYVLRNGTTPNVVAATLPITPELRTTLSSWRPGEESSTSVDMQSQIVVGGNHYLRLGAPLLSAGGDTVGGFLALRSREEELAPFRDMQRTLLLGGGAGLLISFLLSYVIARQITKPVSALVSATRKAAEGDYGTEIHVTSGDEIGTLAQAFRTLLSDLRDKEALVEILQSDSEAKTVQLKAAVTTLQDAATAHGITPGSTLSKRYHIKEILGIGGMGTVFRARDAELDEIVAIKTLRPEILSQDASALERFKGEIRLARRISHRNVVRTHDLGEVNGVYFISMEFVEGKSLKDLIGARGRLPASATLTIGKQLLRALEVAHEQGVIHRDIKPQNVVVTPDGVLKVMDFGIARLADRKQGVTQAGMVVGTPDYMAPEQLLGDDVDARADLYAAGVVLYECLTGNTPFTADSPITLITKVLEERPRSPRDVNPDVPAQLAELVLRALDKDRARRPQTATEFHDALESIETQAVLSRPMTPGSLKAVAQT
jgi:serine/threonine-protein kinase